MLFNSPDFIIFFIFVVSVVVIFKYRKFQHLFLLVASYFFFYYTSNYLIILLIFSTLLDFYAGREIWKSQNITRKKIIFSISLAGNLGLLGFFKYADFGISQINAVGSSLGYESIPFLNLALPIGISFYTFQTISYTADIYRGKLEPSKTLREFALFVAFFPQLVAGPIVRAKDFLPQLREKMENFGTNRLSLISIHDRNLKLGITIMAFGFLKKMFFADNIAPMVNTIFQDPIGASTFEIWLGAIGFAFQIYGDFSGYSDIAIGAALILGFKIPINFNKPYFATSPSDFWRRWHISLSSWLRDYLYIPLGGNKKSSGRTYFNLIAVMFLGGLWHGASWNFVVWGLLHGLYLTVHKLILNKFPILKNNSFFKSKIGKIVSISVTQYFVFLAWIPFRVRDVDSMMYSIEKYVLIDLQFSEIADVILSHKLPVLFLSLFIILHFISYRKENMIDRISKFSIKYWVIVLTIIALMITFTYSINSQDFIYFKF
ncbi:MBOAT family O-acyltransferase [Nitrosopumilus adriaticus]|uniref:Putative alginate O-acetyltransferase AlgI n=1 Tax=Nitrosopumilus adriaticus TaxID=1580092 RepID=A0A0D5C5K2_9ARCH|nr:MBOAT family O-acyltransferase [Nitrosopumilus adriaticus]AJW71803.1 putative alginate O-acetyltransferase AlgI [Nitrosopumilus adriaticus]